MWYVFFQQAEIENKNICNLTMHIVSWRWALFLILHFAWDLCQRLGLESIYIKPLGTSL